MSERQASTYRQGEYTPAHIRALNIVGLNKVIFLSEQVIPIWGQFDSKGRPVSYKLGILINDPDFGSGVILVDGDIHKKLKVEKKDEQRDIALGRKGQLWVEHIANEDVASIMQVLEKHRRQRDDYS